MSPYSKLIVLFAILFSTYARAQTADFTATPTSGCAPLLVQFNNLSSGATSYYWDFGNLATSTIFAPSTVYTSPGTYTVTLIAYNGPNSNTKVVTNYITVYAPPTVSFHADDTTVCAGVPVTFTNTSNPNTPGNASYFWDFGDGNHSTDENPVHAYAVGGNFSVTLNVTNSQGCAATYVWNSYIEVYSKPNAEFICPTTAFCNPPGIVTFNNTSTGTPQLSYSWLFGDATTSTAQTPPPHTYGSGSFTVTLIVTDGNGCVDSLIRPGYINVASNTASFTAPASACQGEMVTFTNTTAPPITGSVWNFGDNTTGIGTLVTHTYFTPGTYQVQLASQAACVDTIYKTIVIHPKPVIDFSYTPVTPCQAPDTIFFNNLTTNGNTYKWYFGDGDTSILNNPWHIYPSEGPWDVKLVATNSFGCADSLVKPQYIFLQPFIVSPNADVQNGCAPLTTHFYYTTAYPQPIVSQLWDFDDNTPTSTLANPTHTYTDTGTYHVTVTLTSINGCTNTGVMIIHVGVHSTPDFYAVPTQACVHESIQFYNNSLNATDYAWFFGDNFVSGDSAPVHQYLFDDSFDVMLISFNNGCPDTLKKLNYVIIRPSTSKFDITYDCDSPKKVILTNHSTKYTSFIWSFGDNTTSTVDTSPIHRYTNLNFYNVKLVTYNSTYGCKDSITQTVKLTDPIPRFHATDTTLCRNNAGFFFADIDFQSAPPLGVHNLTWTTNAISYNSHDTAMYHYIYTNGGRYDVTLSTTDEHNCFHSFTRSQYMLVAQPVAGFMASPTDGCLPLNVQFTDTTQDQPGTFDSLMFWNFGYDTATVNTAVTNYTYYNAGSFYVKLVVTDNIGCMDSVTKLAYINTHNPVASFYTADVFPCMYDSVPFFNISTGGVGPFTSFWNFGDNSTSTETNPVHIYTDTGSYTVTLIVVDSLGCRDTSIMTQYIQITRPHAAFTLDDSVAVCSPMHVNFTSTSTNATDYRWDFGNTNTSILADPSNLYVDPGDYTVRCIALDVHGCPDTAYGHVKLLGYAGAFTYTPITGCTPLLVNFTASVTNVDSLIWDFGDGNTVPGNATISHVYNLPGTYLPILVFGDASGCHSLSIGLDTLKLDGLVTDYKFSPDPVCEFDKVTFSDTFPQIVQYNWAFDNGETSTLANPQHNFTTPGSHPVNLVVFNSTGCSDTVSKEVTVHALPVIRVSADTTVCKQDQAVLQAEGGIFYAWSPPDRVLCPVCSTTYAKPGEAQIYSVIGTDEFGCKNTDSVDVALRECNCIVSVPTAFSPNGDGKNDRLKVLVTDMVSIHMEIYNRWGQPVFYTTYPDHSWDGTYKGVPCDAGTYYYFVKVKCVRGQEVMKKGDLILVR